MTSVPSPDATAADTSSRQTIPALTGLRALAAMAVYCSHVGAPSGSPPVLERIFGAGYMGVTLFFVLSGFVLTHRYFDELSRPDVQRVGAYVWARIARIYPMYLAALLFAVLRMQAQAVPLQGLGWHLLGLQAWRPNLNDAYAFNSPAWSISVELFLYACFPLLVVLFCRRSRNALVVIGGVAAAVIIGLAWWWSGHDVLWTETSSSHRWLYRWPVTRLGDFTVGIVLARLCHGRSRIGGFIAAAGAAAILVAMASPTTFYTAWGWDAAYILPVGAVIGGIAVAPVSSRLARLLSRPVLIRLGEASFAFYLIHLQLVPLLGAGSWAKRSGLSAMVYGVVACIAIWCMALGLHQLVETPARRFLMARQNRLRVSDRPSDRLLR